MGVTVDELAEAFCVDPGDVLALIAMYPDDVEDLWEEEGVLSPVAWDDLATVLSPGGERVTVDPADHASAPTRWALLAAQANSLRDSEPSTSVATPYRPETWRAFYALEAAIARTEHPEVAEWAVSRFLIERRPIEECVRLEREEHPRPRIARPVSREPTESQLWHREARAEAFRAEQLRDGD